MTFEDMTRRLKRCLCPVSQCANRRDRGSARLATDAEMATAITDLKRRMPGAQDGGRKRRILTSHASQRAPDPQLFEPGRNGVTMAHSSQQSRVRAGDGDGVDGSDGAYSCRWCRRDDPAVAERGSEHAVFLSECRLAAS
jgi:hypothetical protein